MRVFRPIHAADANLGLGWLLVVLGWLIAAVWDPLCLGTGDEPTRAGNPAFGIRYAQMAVLRMAFLELAIAQVVREFWSGTSVGRAAARMVFLGACSYAAGHLLVIRQFAAVWLLIAGAVLNAAAAALLFGNGVRRRLPSRLNSVLLIACAGMLLDGAVGLLQFGPELRLARFIGPSDGLPQRMLRLAQVAVIALAVLTHLFRRQTIRLAADPADNRYLCLLVIGTILMPVVLTVAACLWLPLKYLLPFPAMAVTIGAGRGLWQAWNHRLWLPLGAWGFIVVSLAAGLVFGLFAFDGPLPAPEPLGSYNGELRFLLRLGHAYAVVVGILVIFLADCLRGSPRPGAANAALVAALVGGSITVLTVFGVAANWLRPIVLSVGPLILSGATLYSLILTLYSAREAALDRSRLSE